MPGGKSHRLRDKGQDVQAALQTLREVFLMAMRQSSQMAGLSQRRGGEGGGGPGTVDRLSYWEVGGQAGSMAEPMGSPSDC